MESLEEAKTVTCPPWLRHCLMIALAVHLLGVLAEPLRFFSRSAIRTAPEFGLLRETLKPYAQWMYLDHGYFFFAPNPGPSHLVQCTLSDTPFPTSELPSPESQKSTAPASSSENMFVFPSLKAQWPRLLYHRYFMLSEFYNARSAPRQVSDEDKKDPEFMARWTFDRDLYEQLQKSMTKSLSHTRGAKYVELRRLERSLPDSYQVLKDGWKLDDPRLLEVLPETIEEPAKSIDGGELPPKKAAEAKP